MSNALAISAVSAVLRRLLEDALAEADVGSIVGGSPSVTVLPPDRVTPPSQADPNQLNLYLYQTVPNAGWSNSAWPIRDSDGVRTGSAPLALNLRYLLTAYGASAYAAEILLGHAMRAFHEFSVIPRDRVRTLLNPHPAPNGWITALGKTGLAEQVEQIKIGMESISTEEMSRLWSALQAKYRTTAVYVVSVVVIDSGIPFRAALPVATRVPSAGTLPFLEITEIQTTDNKQITAGSTLSIIGSGFTPADTAVRVGAVTITPVLSDIRANEIAVTITNPPPAGLLAGVIPVKVTHSIYESNASPIVFHPIATFTPQSITTDTVNGVVFAKGSVRMALSPPVTRVQNVQLLLNQFQPPPNTAARGYTFPAEAGNGIPANQTEIATIDIPISGVIPGQYLARVRVDGADSLLELSGGVYATPLVTI